jgi:hypothetical protein
VSRLAAAYRKASLDAEVARKVRDALAAGEPLDPLANPRALPGDPLRLRGIPAVGHGVSGAIPGTHPLGALLAKEAHQRS